ncbi:MAG TPA: pseudouridine-5'-phosphate glycosidase, partial [Chloroflexota bacterium]|nr:pseudouridine-5'-phosphate glycosidase [Chloroflexota bacterium]
VETTGDVSNDLQMLSKHPVVVVSSGFKSILDLPRTLEYLETLGVPITGYKTTTLPDFYGSDSGHAVPRVDHPRQVAAMLRTQQEIGLCGGIVVANPPPEDLAFNRDELGQLVQSALAAAASAGIRGKDVTPFLLSWLAGASGGRTVELNVALLISNARVAAEIAGALASA